MVNFVAAAAGAAGGALGKLVNFATAGGGEAFPSDLRGHGQNFILFRAVKDNQQNRTSAPLESTVATVVLPLPSNLTTTYNAQYSVEGIGALGKLASEATAGGGGAQGVAQRLSDMFKENNGANVEGALLSMGTTAAAAGAGVGAGAAAGGAAGAAAGGAIAPALKGGMFGAGIAQNPHLAALFTGTSFRTHTFQYKFNPRDSSESDSIRSIIRTFKYHMAPAYRAEGHFFDYPEQWGIDIIGSSYLFAIGTSVLTGFEVGYGGEGSAYFEDTNAPFTVSLGLTFQEVAITTKAEILGGR